MTRSGSDNVVDNMVDDNDLVSMSSVLCLFFLLVLNNQKFVHDYSLTQTLRQWPTTGAPTRTSLLQQSWLVAGEFEMDDDNDGSRLDPLVAEAPHKRGQEDRGGAARPNLRRMRGQRKGEGGLRRG